MRILAVAILSLSIGFCPSLSWACIGNGPAFEVGFSPGSNNGHLIATLRDKESGETKQVYDDTGLVSAHLGVTYLSKVARSSGSGKVPAATADPVLSFMHTRLSYFKELLTSALSPIDTAQKKAAIAKIDALMQKARPTGREIDSRELEKAIFEMNMALQEARVKVTAKTRTSADSDWGPETPLHQLELPSYAIDRSLGCNAGISSFNSRVNSSGLPATGTSGSTGSTQ